MPDPTVGLSGAWSSCTHCEQRHAPDYDCRTYVPVCVDCGHQGNRRFRYARPGGKLRDVLAPSLGPEALECPACGSTEIRMGYVDA